MFTVLRIEEPVKECDRPHAGVSEFYKQHIHSGKYPVGILRKDVPLQIRLLSSGWAQTLRSSNTQLKEKSHADINVVH